MINRSLVILKPKAPYLEWANALPGPAFDADTQEPTAYLVPQYETPEEAIAVLDAGHAILFESELASWHLVEEDWPENRDFAMFQDWFEVNLHELIIDLCEGDLVSETFETESPESPE